MIFIEEYGEEKFKLYFEEYADMVDDIGIDVVLAYLENFDISTYQVAVNNYQVNIELALEISLNQ